MSARKAYKPLYLSALERVKTLEAKLFATRATLAEVENALIPHGQKTLEAETREGLEPIRLAPLEFVAARAFINSHARLTMDPFESPSYADHYAWRARPIVRTNAKT